MRNKIYKISFILLFMIFITGAFNSCFAEELKVYSWTSEEFSDVLREDNVVSFNYLGNDYSITIDSTYNYKYYAVVYNGSTSSLRILTSDYPYSSQIWKSGYSHTLNMCTHSSFVVDENNVASQYNQGSSLAQTAFNCSKITYKFNGSNWVKDSSTSMKAGGSYTYSATNATISDNGDVFLYCDNNIKYHDNTYNYLYYKETKLTEEEIKNQFDFKINIDFQKKLEHENYIDRTDGYCALITHSLVGWEDYYNVEVDITTTQTGIWKIWSERFYLDYYNKNNDLLHKKMYIKGEGSTNWYNFKMNEGDYFTIFNQSSYFHTVILKYTIYDKDNNLLATREIRFHFDDESNDIEKIITGTIWSDKYLDNNGNDISNNKDDVNTNGSNTIEKETTSNDMDNILNNYTSNTDLNSLVNNASNTINLFKICFDLLPAFIWVMISSIIIVLIALRILGR